MTGGEEEVVIGTGGTLGEGMTGEEEEVEVEEEEYHLVCSLGFCLRVLAVRAVCYGLNLTKGTSLQLKHLSQTHSA